MREELEQAGLDPKEAEVYLAVLELGNPTVARAAEAAQVSRTSAYDVVRRLSRRGLVTVTEIGPTGEPAGRGRGVLRATDPEQFLTEWRERGNVLKELVPRLKAVMSTQTSRPRVRYLEGHAGITAALWETLTWGVPLKGILSMADLLQVPGRPTMDEYIAQRRDRGITLRVVRSPEKETDKVWPTNARDLREVRFAPPQHTFTMTMMIGSESVAVISSRRENFAMMIDSSEYADLQSGLFDQLWAASTPT
ncbi:TrmB family transcriptional regulator [Dactylosporangium darangshiense]|uniref:Transcription regulator TrmB N-terminal domain-containing protein n=1 Tax=Dactylosporangium darangshiense TaxID=579108 RepID=A0ABP8DTN4_9ACTN